MKLRNVISNEICDAEAREDGIYIKANWSDEEKWFRYDLETLARGWDYYVEPKEPLIKDEKIRKAVRTWADANDIPRNATTIEYQLADTIKGTFSEFWCDNLHIMFRTNVAPSAIHGKFHSINELCGEEEIKESEDKK